MTVVLRKDIVVQVAQPVTPAGARVPDIGLVEITTPRVPIPGPPGPPGPGVSVSDTPPADPVDGDLWWESDTGILWAWYEDPDSAQWAQISGGVGGPENLVTPTGAAGDGVANDSAAWSSAITARRNIHAASGKSYAIKDVVLSHSQSMIGHDAILKAAAGATNMVVLTGYASRLSSVYIADNLASSGAAVKVGISRVARVENVTVANSGAGGIVFEPGPGGEAANGIIQGLIVTSCAGAGIYFGSSSNVMRFSDFFVGGKSVPPDVNGKYKPQPGSIGWRANTPVVGGIAVGGTQIVNGTFLGLDTGMWITDGQLLNATNAVIDSCTGYGLKLDGDSFKNDFYNLFCAVTAGIHVSGTTTDNTINGLRTNFNGSIPSWAPPDYYTVPGPYFDVQVRDTATLTIRNWHGDKKIAVDATAKLIVLDGINYEGKTVGTVPAATTTYLGVQGQTATEFDVIWRVPYDCFIIRLMPSCTSAPGAGQSYTYTARKNAADTTLVVTLTGTGVFGGTDTWSGTHISANRSDYISIKLVTSAASGVARHSCIMQIAPR